jgi:hypothetical protein
LARHKQPRGDLPAGPIGRDARFGQPAAYRAASQ